MTNDNNNTIMPSKTLSIVIYNSVNQTPSTINQSYQFKQRDNALTLKLLNYFLSHTIYKKLASFCFMFCAFNTIDMFLPCNAMLMRYMLSLYVCPSIRL